MLIIKRSSSRAAALLYIVSYISISITSGSSIQKEEDSVSLRGGRRRLQESPYLLQQQPQQQTSPYLQQQPQLVGAEPQSPYLQQGEESQASPYLQQPQQDGQLIAAEPQLASPYLQQAQQEEVLLAPEPQNELLDEAGWEIGGGQLATGTELQASPVESDVKASWQELEEASWKKNDEEPKLSPEDQNENELEEQAPQMAPTQPPVHELTPEELNQKQMRSYLGGLIPSVDENILPMFLRNTLETKGGYAMDLYGGSGEPVLKNRDLVFYWHGKYISWIYIIYVIWYGSSFYFRQCLVSYLIFFIVPRTGGLTMKNISKLLHVCCTLSHSFTNIVLICICLILLLNSELLL